jgi:glucokinase
MTVNVSGVLSLPLREDLRLAVDAGGSTLRIAVCDLAGQEQQNEKIPYPQERFRSLDEGIAWFLREVGFRPSFAVVGVAGPIEKGRRVKLTNNTQWPEFDADDAERELGIGMYLCNDLIIAAASLPVLTENDVEVLRPGYPDENAPKIVATLSTGVNDALCLPEIYGPLGYLPAESGFTPFAPRSDVEIDLLRWVMHNGLHFVGFEHIIAGSHGFQRVFDFVTQKLGISPLPSTLDALAGGVPPGPPLTKAGLEDKDPAALKVFEIIGGATASYLQSRVIGSLATGGVYLVGSVAQNRGLMQYFLDSTPFLERFADAGPYDRMMKDVPIYRILHKEFGLLGASRIASRLGG